MSIQYNYQYQQSQQKSQMQLFRSPSIRNPNGQLSTSLVMPSQPSSPTKSIKKSRMIRMISQNQSEVDIQKSDGLKRNNSILSSSRISKKRQPSPNKPFNNQQSLLPILENSQKMIKQKPYLRQEVENSRLQREERVYGLEVDNSPNQILGQMYGRLNRNNRQLNKQIEEVVKGSIRNNVSKGVSEGKPKRKIPRGKEELRELEQIDKYRLLKIKNGEIKHKIGDLRQKLEHQYYVDKARRKNILPEHDNIKQSDYYSLENPKTQEAKLFVSKLRNQRREDQLNLLELKQMQHLRHQEQQRQRELYLKQEQEQRKHLQQILYAEKKSKRNYEHEENEKKLSEIKQWAHKLKANETPLYVRKENEYIQNQVIPKIYEKHKILDSIRKERQSIHLDEIDEHDKHYMEHLEEVDLERSIKFEMKKNELYQDAQDQSKYFKGKFRYHALEDMYKDKLMSVNQQQQRKRETEKVKRARQIMYSDQIRGKQRERSRTLNTMNPKRQLKRRERGINGSIQDPNVSHRSDPKSDGKKNLHYLHNLVQERGVKKDKPVIRLIEERGVYPDYMEEAREQRLSLQNSKLQRARREDRRAARKKHQNEEQSQDQDNQNKNSDKYAGKMDEIGQMKAISSSMDERLQRNYRRKLNDHHINFEDDKRMEEEDIEAIQAKIRLFRKVD